MTTTSKNPTDVTSTSALEHPEAMSLFDVELQRNLDLMRSLQPADWTAPTDCPAWDVRELYLHVLGACESGAATRELLHQMRTARRLRKEQGGPLEAALSAVQVRERISLTPEELVTRFASTAPKTVRQRSKLPSLLRRATMKVDGPVVEKWSLGYLVDTIYLRDAWMHRIDAARATGADLVLTPEHDGRIVADVVSEWSNRHGRPFALTLTGPAGGSFTGNGPASELMELDAIEFCRILAGRSAGSGLLTTIVPF